MLISNTNLVSIQPLIDFTIIFLLSERPSWGPPEIHRRPIGDQHVWSEIHWRPTFLIGDSSETDMSDRRFIGYRHAWSEIHRRPTCLIGDPSDTNMLDRRSIGDRHALHDSHFFSTVSTFCHFSIYFNSRYLQNKTYFIKSSWNSKL